MWRYLKCRPSSRENAKLRPRPCRPMSSRCTTPRHQRSWLGSGDCLLATGWTECLPVLVRNGALFIEALAAARSLFPFALRGVDFDNDGLFMNEPVVQWCGDEGSKSAKKTNRPA
jgi:hypothetical protein